jgi:hypothetical protein
MIPLPLHFHCSLCKKELEPWSIDASSIIGLHMLQWKYRGGGIGTRLLVHSFKIC